MVIESDKTLRIRTPEGVIFALQLAGPFPRFLAWSIDMVTIAVMSSLVNSILGIIGVISSDLAMAFSVLGTFVISIGYGILMEWRWQGQTIGKRLMKLRVLDSQGLNLQFSQVVIRNLLRFADALPMFYMAGGLTCLLTRHSQRLGDIAANTIVVSNPSLAEPDLDQILGGKFNSLSAYPHLSARLRQKVTPHEAALALQAVLRRDDLEDRARVELFAEIADHLRPIAPFPTEATDGISDEQYLRNVIDIVYRPKGQRHFTKVQDQLK